ncbi:MAG: DNA-directed RNA polymerase subunit alpha [Dehalococcoidales bacterium]|nr:DNA-directed RNA polymerase subunit alpha [Dehalococcoidales bacterium]
MSRLVIPKITCVESKDNFGQFLAEPLEKGFGVTLGNSLRRVLLSYLPGAAVTGVMIEGIQHEFSSVPYVKEDVTELVLNVKELRLIPLSGQPGKLILEAEGEGRVYASDIRPSIDLSIANPELYLATLDSPEAKLYVELDVEIGEGYQLASSSDNLPIGVIPIDAIFTPVRKVNFAVEPTHVGQVTSRERLSLEVWTDGTISPVEALTRSATILVEQLTAFVDYAQVSRADEEEQVVRLSIPEELFNMPVTNLNLSVRTMNCLRRGDIETVGQVISKGESELLALRNFGEKSKEEIEERLEELGLSLKPQAEESTTPEEEGVEGEA